MELNNWLEQIKTELAAWSGGETFIQSRDSRGDGYDIACAPHVDDFSALVDLCKPFRVTVGKMYANGYFCGYVLRKPRNNDVTVLSQHSGNWGPWYHVSIYRPTGRGTWRYVSQYGHYNSRNCPAVDYPGGPSTLPRGGK